MKIEDMATVTIKINSRSNIGKYLIGLAKELAKNTKSIVVEENQTLNKTKISEKSKLEFIKSLSEKTNRNLTKKLFEKHGVSYTF